MIPLLWTQRHTRTQKRSYEGAEKVYIAAYEMEKLPSARNASRDAAQHPWARERLVLGQRWR